MRFVSMGPDNERSLAMGEPVQGLGQLCTLLDSGQHIAWDGLNPFNRSAVVAIALDWSRDRLAASPGFKPLEHRLRRELPAGVDDRKLQYLGDVDLKRVYYPLNLVRQYTTKRGRLLYNCYFVDRAARLVEVTIWYPEIRDSKSKPASWQAEQVKREKLIYLCSRRGPDIIKALEILLDGGMAFWKGQISQHDLLRYRLSRLGRQMK